MTNHFLPKLHKKTSYVYILLDFLQKNPDLEVAGVDFFHKRNFPWLGQYPTARLSELKELWLIDIVGKRKNKLKNLHNINIYKINNSWLKYILSD